MFVKENTIWQREGFSKRILYRRILYVTYITFNSIWCLVCLWMDRIQKEMTEKNRRFLRRADERKNGRADDHYAWSITFKTRSNMLYTCAELFDSDSDFWLWYFLRYKAHKNRFIEKTFDIFAVWIDFTLARFDR